MTYKRGKLALSAITLPKLHMSHKSNKEKRITVVVFMKGTKVGPSKSCVSPAQEPGCRGDHHELNLKE